MEKLWAALSVFRKGAVVADPAAWKNGQITVAVLTGFIGSLVALAKTFGYSLPLSDADLASIAGAVLAVTGLFIHPAVTVASSDKVGLPPVSKPPVSGGTPWANN